MSHSGGGGVSYSSGKSFLFDYSFTMEVFHSSCHLSGRVMMGEEWFFLDFVW